MTNEKVQDEVQDPEVAPATLEEPAEVAKATQGKKSVDASDDSAKLREDLNKMKSSFQKREYEKEKQWNEQRAQYEQQLEKFAIQGMDEEQRKVYETRKAQEQQSQLYQELERYQQEAAEAKANSQAMQFFLAKGVPAVELDLEGGYDALVTSGWNWIEQELTRLRSVSANPPATTTKVPPDVVTTTTPSTAKPTWQDLEKKYGSQEEVYRLVESGHLDPSIIPL